ncbi:MAG TPA: class I SAM-dependent methyltransferase [Gemmatimonadaceae bacterium]|nr:class I SAM-dependent methyltransferase [Gemmatimonadaceae bacterium]
MNGSERATLSLPNAYSRRWFSTFLGRIDAGVVEREVAFLRRQLPPPPARLLDLCCGPGRHAAPLSEGGHRVVGLDLDSLALADAFNAAPDATFVRADMRRLPLDAGSVDAAICMWQSFGHFDAAGNLAVLSELARVLAPNGVLVMDLYHRDAMREGERVIERNGERVHESRTMRGDRLLVQLRYESTGDADSFDWRLFTPATLQEVASGVGFEVLLVCAEFDERFEASSEHVRMQIVLSRTA